MSTTPPSTITIQTERGRLQLPAPCTVADALRQLLPPPADHHGVATAVNGQFVPRHQRAQHPLAEGDQLLCFSPITGG